jgi:RNA polymerase-binding transcription factor DksA
VTQTTPATLMPTMQSLEPLERLSLRDRLQDLWRDTVEHITTLAVRFHSTESEVDPVVDQAALAKRLAHLRLDLTEIEAAMRRMDVGRYGGCESCAGSIPYDELTAQPHRRWCDACRESANLARHPIAPIIQAV